MPRKQPGGAAPSTSPAEDPSADEGPATNANHVENVDPSVEELATEELAKPKKGGRARAAEDAAERKVADDKPLEDWTKPEYANDPGAFDFDSMDDGDEYLSVLWWGREGTGKTTDLARVASEAKWYKTSVPAGNVLLINAEAGAKRTALRHHGVDTGRISLYPPRGQQLTFEGLERLFYRLQADLEEDPNSWVAVGWDSITAIYQKLLDDVIEADIRRQAEILQRANRGRGGRSGNITLRDRFETDRDDYASMSNQVNLLLRKYRTLPCHFLVTALERRDEDKDERKGTKKPQYGPAVSPALQTNLLGYVDVVIRCHVLSEGVYYGRTTPTEDSRGKDRMFALPVELVNPTFDRIHGYVHGALKEENDPAQRRMPGGAEGTVTRRSLADDYSDLPYDPPATDEPVDPWGDTGDTDDDPMTNGDKPEKPALAVDTKPPVRTSGRKTPAVRADAAAKAEAIADGIVDKTPPPRRARKGGAASTAAPKSAGQTTAPGGFSDEPPF